MLSSGEVPASGRCDFEYDGCGWKTSRNKSIQLEIIPWYRNNGSTETANTGPRVDHTLGTPLGKFGNEMIFVNIGDM